ncbi:hypothetical protein VAE032_220154 [Vibrio aestuarianus]|nr:hypothetical protein VAE032_220154 [Vibrio aestuarianus]
MVLEKNRPLSTLYGPTHNAVCAVLGRVVVAMQGQSEKHRINSITNGRIYF